jgi:hypothetical protein
VLVDLHEFHSACAHTDQDNCKGSRFADLQIERHVVVFVMLLVSCPTKSLLVAPDEVG